MQLHRASFDTVESGSTEAAFEESFPGPCLPLLRLTRCASLSQMLRLLLEIGRICSRASLRHSEGFFLHKTYTRADTETARERHLT